MGRQKRRFAPPGPGSTPGAGKITIGRPLPNVSIHLLDQQLQPVPRGSAGEIYIGGAGVGLGYLHRDDLSRARFLPDPFSLDGERQAVPERRSCD